MAARRGGTKARIVEASLELFNQHGERAMTTNHIAAHLGISPGNLYYHFRNKEEILVCLLSEYGEALDEAFSPPAGPLNAERMLGYLNNLFDILWRFRFLYINLAELLARDPQLREHYALAQSRLAGKVEAILEALRAGDLLEFGDTSPAELAELLRMVVTSSLSYQQIQAGGGALSQSAVVQSILRILVLLGPYFSASGRDAHRRLVSHYRERFALR